jgi:hypothetical protein
MRFSERSKDKLLTMAERLSGYTFLQCVVKTSAVRAENLSYSAKVVAARRMFDGHMIWRYKIDGELFLTPDGTRC